jgi:holliday junction DNA helicase RuvA
VIASLRGTLVSKTTGQIVIDVAGVGYLVNVTANTAAKLTLGQEVQLFTAMVVREDAMTLFGFASALEQELFDALRSVTGVGPKSALMILAALTPSEIASAVATENDSAFKAVSGIGPKTAKLITVTLAGKLSHLVVASNSESATSSSSFEEVAEALAGLGWSEKLASDAVREANKQLGSAATRDSVLKCALAILGSAKSGVTK